MVVAAETEAETEVVVDVEDPEMIALTKWKVTTEKPHNAITEEKIAKNMDTRVNLVKSGIPKTVSQVLALARRT